MQPDGDLILLGEAEQGHRSSLDFLAVDLEIQRTGRLSRQVFQGDRGIAPPLLPLSGMQIPPPGPCLPSEPPDQERQETGLVTILQVPELRPEIAQDGLDQVPSIEETPQPRIKVDHPDLEKASEKVADELLLQAGLVSELPMDRSEDGILGAEAFLQIRAKLIPSLPANPGATQRS